MPAVLEIGLEEVDQLVIRHGAPDADGGVVSEQDTVNGCAILHSGRNFAGNSPLPFKFELQRTDLIGLHRAGAEFRAEIEGGRQLEPLAHR